MISEELFMAWWPLLCERFNREPSTALAGMYHESLSRRLGDQEFEAAASRLFETHTRGFPSPQEFLEAARGDTREVALEQWQLVQGLMRGELAPGRLDGPAQRVVRMLGGTTQLRQSPLEEVKWLRREFLGLYQDVAEAEERQAAPALSPPTEEARGLLEEHVPNLLTRGEEA